VGDEEHVVAKWEHDRKVGMEGGFGATFTKTVQHADGMPGGEWSLPGLAFWPADLAFMEMMG
jgi:hypothetical protein